MEKGSNVPVLLAFQTKNGNDLKAWCPYCASFHLHGKGEGHRLAHCQKGPFLETGYILKVVSSHAPETNL